MNKTFQSNSFAVRALHSLSCFNFQTVSGIFFYYSIFIVWYFSFGIYAMSCLFFIIFLFDLVIRVNLFRVNLKQQTTLGKIE